MTTKPTIQTARTDGYVVTHTDWNTNILQENAYAFEVAAGTNTDKIAVASLSGVQGYYDSILVNGGLEVWQRGPGPFNSTGTAVIHADSWWISNGAPSTLSVSQAAASISNSKYMASGTYTHGTAGSGFFYQRVENFAEYAGRVLTFVVSVFTATGGGCYVQIADGVSANNSSMRSAPGVWTTVYVPYTVAAAPTFIQCAIIFDVSTGTTTFAIDNAACYEGNITAPYFVAIPPDLDLQKCLRHYQKIDHSQRFKATAANEFRDVGLIYPVRMMAAPTVTLTTTGTRGNIASATVADVNIEGHRYELQATAGAVSPSVDTFSIDDTFTLVSDTP